MVEVSISKDLEELFRKKAMEKYGRCEGAVSKALEEAIRLWLRCDYELTGEEEVNNRAFESMVEELEANYPGMYVVIAGGRLVSVHETLEEALKVEEGKYKHRIVFRVGEKPVEKVRLGWRAMVRSAGHT